MMHRDNIGEMRKKHRSHEKHLRVPYRLIHCSWVYPMEEFAPFFGYYFFNVMLLVLQMLHLYWAVLISRMAYKCIFSKVCLPGPVCLINVKYMHDCVFNVSSLAHLHVVAGRRREK